MAQMTIRNIDDDSYERLKRRAHRNGRSLEAEVRRILQDAAQPSRQELRAWSQSLRARLEGRYEGDSTAEIRADRDR